MKSLKRIGTEPGASDIRKSERNKETRKENCKRQPGEAGEKSKE